VQVNGSPYGFDNSITEDFLHEHRGRFAGVAAIAPDTPDLLLERLDASPVHLVPSQPGSGGQDLPNATSDCYAAAK
jgi:hypothetical protein